MSTLEATVLMLQSLPESELLTIYDLTRRLYTKQNKDIEFKVMTEAEMIDKLDTSRKHAEEGMVMDADVAISKLRVKYGL